MGVLHQLDTIQWTLSKAQDSLFESQHIPVFGLLASSGFILTSLLAITVRVASIPFVILLTSSGLDNPYSFDSGPFSGPGLYSEDAHPSNNEPGNLPQDSRPSHFTRQRTYVPMQDMDHPMSFQHNTNRSQSSHDLMEDTQPDEGDLLMSSPVHMNRPLGSRFAIKKPSYMESFKAYCFNVKNDLSDKAKASIRDVVHTALAALNIATLGIPLMAKHLVVSLMPRFDLVMRALFPQPQRDY